MTVIRAPETRWGTRPEWGKFQHAQIAILALKAGRLSGPTNYTDLAEQVSKWLSQKHGKAITVNRDTVRRAVKALRAQGSLDKL
jgi:hypothetical protein